jgi:hypothetical protein
MVEDNGTEAWIAKQLKAEAERHEPDLERIRRLIQERDGHQSARRSAWLLPAAAATFVALTAGAITAVYTNQSSDPRVQVSGQDPTATTDTLVPTAASPGATATTVPPTTSATTAEPTGTATSAAVKPTRSTISSPPTASAPRPEVEVKLARADAGQAVQLPNGAVDWIAAGSESATQTVRSKSGGQRISGPHETGTATSTTTTGPFALSWSDGLSEPRQSGSRTWRTVSGPVNGPETGLFVRVPAGKRSAALVLYVGAEGADGELRTQLGAQGKVTRTRLRATTGGGYVVTIRFHTERPDAELTVTLIGGSGGSVSLAAAALR